MRAQAREALLIWMTGLHAYAPQVGAADRRLQGTPAPLGRQLMVMNNMKRVPALRGIRREPVQAIRWLARSRAVRSRCPCASSAASTVSTRFTLAVAAATAAGRWWADSFVPYRPWPQPSPIERGWERYEQKSH